MKAETGMGRAAVDVAVSTVAGATAIVILYPAFLLASAVKYPLRRWGLWRKAAPAHRAPAEAHFQDANR